MCLDLRRARRHISSEMLDMSSRNVRCRVNSPLAITPRIAIVVGFGHDLSRRSLRAAPNRARTADENKVGKFSGLFSSLPGFHADRRAVVAPTPLA